MKNTFVREYGVLVTKNKGAYEFLSYMENDDEIILDAYPNMSKDLLKRYHHIKKSDVKTIITSKKGVESFFSIIKNKKIGRNKALKLFHNMILSEFYINVNGKDITLDEVDDSFDFNKMIKYLTNLHIPYDMLTEFFDGCTIYCDLDGNSYDDDHDYFVIEQDKETKDIIDIYSWTEVCGKIYRLSDYCVTWREGKRDEVVNCKGMSEEAKERLEKIITEVFNTTLPKLCVNDLEITKPLEPVPFSNLVNQRALSQKYVNDLVEQRKEKEGE